MKKAQLNVPAPPIAEEAGELAPAAPVAQEESADDLAALAKVSYNPYPSQIHQKVIQPASAQPAPEVAPETPSASDSVVDSDIIDLAKEDVPVSVIADELHRRDQIKKESEEVEIKLH
jgi:hypothetical protein